MQVTSPTLCKHCNKPVDEEIYIDMTKQEPGENIQQYQLALGLAFGNNWRIYTMHYHLTSKGLTYRCNSTPCKLSPKYDDYLCINPMDEHKSFNMQTSDKNYRHVW